MLLCTQTHRLADAFGDETAIRMLAEAGFDALDYSMFGMENPDHHLRGEDAFAYVDNLKKVADECGVKFIQAHAPFVFKDWDRPNYYEEEILPTIRRAIELVSRLGVEIIVVHPLHHLFYRDNAETLYEINMRYYRDLIPTCAACGVKVATENMWTRDPKRGYILDDTCSQPAEFNRYLDDLNSEWIVGCLDLGHCGLVGIDAADMIRAMGKEHIHCLHVHDNDHVSDAHLLPFEGKMDWKAITKALGEIGYTGEFTFEADNFYIGMDPEAMHLGAKYMHDVGRYLIGCIEAARKE